MGRKKRRATTFNTGIHRVLGQVHPYLKISRRAIAVMDSFAKDMLDRIAKEASKCTCFFICWGDI